MAENYKAQALVSVLVGAGTIHALIKKGVLTKQDAAEIYDLALLAIEQGQAVAGLKLRRFPSLGNCWNYPCGSFEALEDGHQHVFHQHSRLGHLVGHPLISYFPGHA